ncbi:MAG: thiamine phosphate synthase [Hyphomonadaceae bacterium]|jgi:thiamine-phosphate pyrophosphorylase|nr:thiamine phosphate synthase [Hyphomonadaceae bacterium]
MSEALAAADRHLKRLIRLARAAPDMEIWQLSDPDRLSAETLATFGPLPVAGTIVRHYGRIEEIASGLSLPGTRFLSAPVPDALILPGTFGLYWPSVHVRGQQRSHRLRRAPVMASAHTAREVARALKHGITRIVVSPVFASDSPSAGRVLTAARLAMLVRRFPKARMIALGGVHPGTVRQLRRCGIAGIAGVSLSPPAR